MIEAVLYMAAGSLGTLALLAFYACWIAFHEDDDEHRQRRDEKHRNHYKWGHYKGRKP